MPESTETPNVDPAMAELRRLLDAATPGPWAWEMTGDKDNSWGVGIIVDDDENLITGRNETGENLLVESVCEAGADGNPADAELIAAMRNALPGLLAEVECHRAECRGYAAMLHEARREVERLRTAAGE